MFRGPHVITKLIMENNPGGAGDGSVRRLDPIGKLFSDAWRLLNEKGAVVFQILLIPAVLISLPRLSGEGMTGLLAFVGIVLFGAAIPAAISAYDGTMKFGEAYRRGWTFFWAMVWLVILQWFVTIGGFVMLIVPGIIMAVWFTFSHFTLVLEGRRGLDALRRSRHYVTGFWWAVVGRSLLFGIAAWIVMMVISVPLALMFGAMLGGAIANLIGTLAIMPFSMAYSYVLYQNLKALKGDAPDEGGSKTFLAVSGIVGIVGGILLAILIGVGLAAFLRSHPAAMTPGGVPPFGVYAPR